MDISIIIASIIGSCIGVCLGEVLTRHDYVRDFRRKCLGRIQELEERVKYLEEKDK